MSRHAWIVISVVAGLLGACSTAEKPKPTALEAFAPKLAARVAWSAKLDAVNFPLAPAISGGLVTVAGSDGTVLALQAESGREVWRAHVGARIDGGVGSDGRFAAVVTRNNELVVLDAGTVRWRKRLSTQVTTAPLVAGERVFVLGVDRVVQAFDVLDGKALWRMQRPGEPLTLAHGGVVAAFKDTLLVGQGARLAGVDGLRGALRWDVPMATPRGTNELERLTDLVGPPARAGDVVCARAFQAAVACANAERGALLWSKVVSGASAVGIVGDLVAGADSNDRVSAWRLGSGDSVWTVEHLMHRGLTGVAGFGGAVVVGDAQGQLHFLAADSGATVQRLALDGSPVIGQPVVVGSTLIVVTRRGGVFGVRAE